MGFEIERRFLVAGDGWQDGADAGTRIVQGYVVADAARAVRVRVAGERAWLTLKGPTRGATRSEFEYPIPVDDALALLATLCGEGRVEKTRHRVLHAGRVWEVDVFGGAHAGLVLAEVELPAEDAPLARPAWVGTEVTRDVRYSNAVLARPQRLPRRDR
jgi:adenylate cyclase